MIVPLYPTVPISFSELKPFRTWKLTKALSIHGLFLKALTIHKLFPGHFGTTYHLKLERLCHFCFWVGFKVIYLVEINEKYKCIGINGGETGKLNPLFKDILALKVCINPPGLSSVVFKTTATAFGHHPSPIATDPVPQSPYHKYLRFVGQSEGGSKLLL